MENRQESQEKNKEGNHAEVVSCPSPHTFDVTCGEAVLYRGHFSTEMFKGHTVPATPKLLSRTFSFRK